MKVETIAKVLCEVGGLIGSESKYSKIIDYCYGFVKSDGKFKKEELMGEMPHCCTEDLKCLSGTDLEQLMMSVWNGEDVAGYVECDLLKYVYWGFPIIENGDVQKGVFYGIDVTEWDELNTIVAIIDVYGKIHYISLPAVNMTNSQREEVLNSNLDYFIHREDSNHFWSKNKECLVNKTPTITKSRMIVDFKTYKSFIDIHIPFVAHSGRVLGSILIGQEILD